MPLKQGSIQKVPQTQSSGTTAVAWRCCGPKVTSLPKSLEGIEQVQSAKLLGVIFQSTFSFVDHVVYVLKICSQRIYLLKQLRDQGLPLQKLTLCFKPLYLVV